MLEIAKIMAAENTECEKLSAARKADAIMTKRNAQITAPNLNMASAVNMPAPLTLTGNIAAHWKAFK
ncbi:hypothetical protein PR048_023284 [Dryococelus australis]|uniref:Antifreeze protein n=1 Tax=Dryococelus australis TaxID=614101 RepID=A0ABQ9GTM9_9NEOP|nr:hypothetical protein PR048_023284 [Dryococelus australis]